MQLYSVANSVANRLLESLRRRAHRVAPKGQTRSGVESLVIGHDSAGESCRLFLYYHLGSRYDGARWISHGAADAAHGARLGFHSNEQANGPHKQQRWKDDSSQNELVSFSFHEFPP